MINFRKYALLITSFLISFVILISTSQASVVKQLKTTSGETYTVGRQFNETNDERKLENDILANPDLIIKQNNQPVHICSNPNFLDWECEEIVFDNNVEILDTEVKGGSHNQSVFWYKVKIDGETKYISIGELSEGGIIDDSDNSTRNKLFGELKSNYNNTNRYQPISDVFKNIDIQDLKKALDSIESKMPEEYFIYNGKIKTDDDIFTITKRLNKHYGTSYTHIEIAKINGIKNYEEINSSNIIKIGTLDGWKPPNNPKKINVKYWDKLSTEKKKILHYHRNAYQTNRIPETKEELINDQWEALGVALAHNISTSGNIDYRGKGLYKGLQAIYDDLGNLVTTPENMGTYDFEEPTLFNYFYINHTNVDVKPWIEWGNSPQDTTTKYERICAMSKNWKGEKVLKYLNYNFNNCK